MFRALTAQDYNKLDDYPTLIYGLATSAYGPVAIAWWPDTKGDFICYVGIKADLQKATEQLHDLFPHNPLQRNDKKATAFFKSYNVTDKPPSVLMKGSPFYLDVWKTLYKTKCGTTLTYGELAKKAGRPLASRAVGSAMATNPIALIVPCHRVLASGGLGGYGPGPEMKKRLLAAEQ